MLLKPVPLVFRKHSRPARRPPRVTPTPPPTPTTVSIVSVTAVEGGDGVVVFDAGSLAIVGVTDASQLEVSDGGGDWLPCDVVVEFDATSVRLQNPLGFHAGNAWRLLSPMGITWDGDAAMTVPEDGVVL